MRWVDFRGFLIIVALFSCSRFSSLTAEEYLNTGRYKMAEKEYESGLADLNTAIELNSEYVEAYYLRGKLKYLTGDKRGAIKDYTEVIVLDPKHDEAYYWRAFAKQAENDIKGACIDWMISSHLGNETAHEFLDIFCKEG